MTDAYFDYPEYFWNTKTKSFEDKDGRAVNPNDLPERYIVTRKDYQTKLAGDQS